MHSLSTYFFPFAGRVAERRIIETNSTGASNDLEYVNTYAKAVVMKWGLSDKENNQNRSYDYEDYFLMPESKLYIYIHFKSSIPIIPIVPIRKRP